jgi:hypothetical protein
MAYVGKCSDIILQLRSEPFGHGSKGKDLSVYDMKEYEVIKIYRHSFLTSVLNRDFSPWLMLKLSEDKLQVSRNATDDDKKSFKTRQTRT